MAVKWLVVEELHAPRLMAFEVANAVRLALALDRPLNDCVHLALAHRIGAVMLTADCLCMPFRRWRNETCLRVTMPMAVATCMVKHMGDRFGRSRSHLFR